MAFGIRNPEADWLARRLAARRRARSLADELDEIARRGTKLPVLDTRTEEEILGYDEHGLPQ
jgi:antitoxin VapB